MTETTIGNPLKRWKDLISPPMKPIPLNTTFIKILLTICIFAGFSLCYYSVFPISNCLQFNQNLIRNSFKDSTQKLSITEISHILFGIAGSSETWSWRRQYSELWWKPNITRGYVWLDKEPGNESRSETSPPYKISADTTRFSYTNEDGSRSAIRIARIVKESFELGLENVRWFVMGDDDTVFFTQNLVSVLGKYDHREMYYIGGISESVEQNVVHSYTMGYGGGGFAISYPAAKELVRILDACIDRYSELYGSDHRIGACMAEIGVPLTKEPGFHQLDIRGSPYGLLSAHPLAPLVSLHHLDYIQSLFPKISRIASLKRLIKSHNSDPSRTLQHTFCYDLTKNWSISISWGYNVQLYPYLITAKDLRTPLQTFLTWGSWSRGQFEFDIRDMTLEPCNRPVVYYFDEVEALGNQSTLTRYKRPEIVKRQCNREDYKGAYSVRGFNVTAPVFDPEIWNRAPRRQCCEVINGEDEKKGVLDVRIRSCDRWESVTPP